jgi:hypothetical protein
MLNSKRWRSAPAKTRQTSCSAIAELIAPGPSGVSVSAELKVAPLLVPFRTERVNAPRRGRSCGPQRRTVQKKSLLSMLLIALAAFALTACGDSDSDGGGDQDAIVTTIESSANSTDPADCKTYSTQAFLEQTQLVSGEAAVESCEADAEDESDNPDSLEVENVRIGEGTASAEVSYDGGDYNGQTLAVKLIEKDGEWKLNSIARYVDFDREAFLAEFEKGVEESSATPAVKACIKKAVDGADNAELQALTIKPGELTANNKLLADC